jgi:hypothetical protein
VFEVRGLCRITCTGSIELLKTVRLNPTVLLPDPKADVRRFRITATSPLGTKRGTGRISFIDSVLASVDGFYEVVTQRIRPWQAKAPQLPKEGSAVEAAGIDLTNNEPAAENVETPDTSTPAGQEIAASELAADQDFATPEEEDESLVNWESQHEHLAEEREQVGSTSDAPLVGD